MFDEVKELFIFKCEDDIVVTHILREVSLSFRDTY